MIGRLLCAVLLSAVPVTAAVQSAQSGPPATAAALVDEGARLARERQHDLAIQAFRKAMSLDPDSVTAHVGLATTYMTIGRTAEALDPLRRAVYLDVGHLGAQMNLGLALSTLRRFDEAIVHLNLARQIRPGDARLHDAIGTALHSNGRVEEALDAFIEATRLSPETPDYAFNVGFMLMRLGRPGEAIEPFEAALRLNPQHANARLHLSHAYNRVGRYETSIESWTLLLGLRPDFPEALQARAWNALYAGGRGAMAAADARAFLTHAGWQHNLAPFMVIVAVFGSRQAGDAPAADAILDEALARGRAELWPMPVIRYLRGQETLDTLLAAADTPDRRTEARAYAGLDLLMKGRVDEARAHFEWVRDYGNRRFLEYTLAVAELQRLSST